jgi:hypothetical protein
MSKRRARHIGKEILDGIRRLKRGKVGRIVNHSPVVEKRARRRKVSIRGRGADKWCLDSPVPLNLLSGSSRNSRGEAFA